jgi:hypothetical protein
MEWWPFDLVEWQKNYEKRVANEKAYSEKIDQWYKDVLKWFIDDAHSRTPTDEVADTFNDTLNPNDWQW